MKVLLVNVDSLIPNLALMKISAHHKRLGDNVGFNIDDPDIIYASVIFSKNKHLVDGLKFYYPRAKIIIGGSGYDLASKLPEEIEFIKPDYDLYPSEYSQGFATRGCNRDCHFCLVPAKEGRFAIHQHPRDFHDDRFDEIRLMDNNILMDREWFFEVSDWLINHDLTLVDQQFDIRLVDEKVAQRIKELKIKRFLHFAFDSDDIELIIRKKVEMLKQAGLDIRNDIEFYVYVNDDSQYESGLRRCRILKSLSTNSFVMFNPQFKRTRRISKLIRWANRKQIYWKCDLDDYTRKYG